MGLDRGGLPRGSGGAWARAAADDPHVLPAALAGARGPGAEGVVVGGDGRPRAEEVERALGGDRGEEGAVGIVEQAPREARPGSLGALGEGEQHREVHDAR